jgi:hypothetical protein
MRLVRDFRAVTTRLPNTGYPSGSLKLATGGGVSVSAQTVFSDPAGLAVERDCAPDR